MKTMGAIQGAGNGYDDPGSICINVTDEWDIELVVQGRDGGPTASVFVEFDHGVNSIVTLAWLALQAERHVVELMTEAQNAKIAGSLAVTLRDDPEN